MRKLLLVAFLLVLPVSRASAQGGLGLGIILGEPTGISAKAWLTRTTAVDFATAWSFVDEPAFHVHGDYLWHDYDLFPVERGQLPLYYGVGARLKFLDNDSEFGVRVPVGLEYLFDTTPVGLFVELVPLLDLAPDTDFTINSSIGARYYFE
jgi:hypothetical protein